MLDVVAESPWLEERNNSTPAYFILRLDVFSRLLQSFLDDLSGYSERYQTENDVKAPPELLSTVHGRIDAFKDEVDGLIAAAPRELQTRIAR